MTATMLHTACRENDVRQVMDLLNSSEKYSQDDLDFALEEATASGIGRAEVVGLLLSHGAQITTTAYNGAIKNIDTEVFQQFLDKGWDINSVAFGGSHALRLVTQNTECVKWLLDHGADPNQRTVKGITALATAACEPHFEAIKLLISYGAELDPQALYSAMDFNGEDGMPMLKFLIDLGFDVNAKSKTRGTPIFTAIRFGDKEQIKLLLDHGADCSLVCYKKTPLDYARALGQSPEICEMLVPENAIVS